MKHFTIDMKLPSLNEEWKHIRDSKEYTISTHGNIKRNGKDIKSSDAMKKLKIDSSGIIKCCRNKLKKAGGYKWKYKNIR